MEQGRFWVKVSQLHFFMTEEGYYGRRDYECNKW